MNSVTSVLCADSSLVIKDLVYEAKAKAKTFFLKAKARPHNLKAN